MITEDHITVWQWRVRKQEELGWRELGWTMTEEQAQSWAHRNHYVIEKLPNSTARNSGPRVSSIRRD